MRLLTLLFTFCSVALFGGSLNLVNDTAYPLRVVVRASDGTYLGEMVINPYNNAAWSDWGAFGGGGTNPTDQRVTRSRTPYMVSWFCMSGADYSVCDTVPPGATVNANGCDGPRICQPQEKKTGEAPVQQYLYDQNAAPPPATAPAE